MPNRIIRDRGLRSRKLAAASDFGERLYWRLYQAVDDFGRFEADPRIIKGECFSLTDHTPDAIKAGRDEIADLGLLVHYRLVEDEFVQITKFEQRLRAKQSRFPGPNDRHVTVIRPSFDGLDRGSRIEDRGSLSSGLSPRDKGDPPAEIPNSTALPDPLPIAQPGPPLQRPPTARAADPPEYISACPACAAMLRLLCDLTARAYGAPGKAGLWMHQAHERSGLDASLAAIRSQCTRLNGGQRRFLAPGILFKPENWDVTVNEPGEPARKTLTERLKERGLDA